MRECFEIKPGIIAACILILIGALIRIAALQDPAGRAWAFRGETASGTAGVAELRRSPARVVDEPLTAARESRLAQMPATDLLDAWLEVFDPQAKVVLTTGKDGAPGRRGVDDDFDGVLDNAAELGAVGSDDRVVTPIDPDFEARVQRPWSRTVGRGAYVPSKQAEADGAVRVVIHGETRGREWVWPIPLDE